MAGAAGKEMMSGVGMEVEVDCTYSPPVTLLVPKLLPTAPVQRHVLPAAFFHVAVAVAPTLRHVTVRLERGGESMGEAEVSAAAAAKRVRRVDFIVDDSVKRGGTVKEVE